MRELELRESEEEKRRRVRRRRGDGDGEEERAYPELNLIPTRSSGQGGGQGGVLGGMVEDAGKGAVGLGVRFEGQGE